MSVGKPRFSRWCVTFFGVLLILMALPLVAGGIKLLSLGGSSYYAITGFAFIATGILLLRRSLWGPRLFLLTVIGTVIWSLFEVGVQFWPLVPRLGPMIALSAIMLFVLPMLREGRGKRTSYSLAGLLAAGGVLGIVAMFSPHGVIRSRDNALAETSFKPAASAHANWQYYGRDPDGNRFAPYQQITPENVHKLKVAWTVRTGDMSASGVESQNTPIQIGKTLYACTPRNQVLAIDVDSGNVRWRFDSNIKDAAYSRCRGLGYYDSTSAQSPATPAPAALAKTFASSAPAPAGGVDAGAMMAAAACSRRIVMTTVKAQLIELDADTGKLCKSFGKQGMVDLREQIGAFNPKFYFQTSAPTVVRNLIVVGSFVMDGRAEVMPGGVIRAYDVTSGKMVWAFDAGHPTDTTPPAPGTDFVNSTPDMWSTPAFDDKLGMIYLPMGGGSDDFWGAKRSKESDEYSTSILALDIATGHERWKFQTVHHDLWDYDVAPQPALYDVPDGHGSTIPAIVQATKTGQIFLLDRRNGKPIADVKELPVPQGGQPGDYTSPTQPHSVGMPQIGTEPLTEASMWGGTFYDQLECRIAFRKARYEGPFTPITTKPTIFYPGYYGGMNWGGVSIDQRSGLLIVNDIRMPQVVSLVPQSQVNPQAAGAQDSLGLYPETGGAFATRHEALMSSLGIPCNAPPWGTMSGIDLATHKLVWQRPLGSIKDSVLPMGIRSPLPIPVGMPTLGGPMTTASGLTFYSGTQDFYLRAINTQTGDTLWKGRLPVGTQSTPMSYVSPASGKQYVIVTAGGARLSPDHGDYIIAYSLPDAAKPRP